MWVYVGDFEMFRGLNACAIDAKNRVTVPANYRKVLMDEAEGQVVLTIDTEERCLLLYPLPRWLEIEAILQELPTFHAATRRMQRLLIGHATDLELDRQGRVLLPALLREYAGLNESVILVGQGRRIEVWGDAQWQLSRDAWLSEGMGEEELHHELQSICL